MSKCREEYHRYLQEHPHTAVGFDHFAYIYNARGKVDKEICESSPERMTGFGTYICDGDSCAKAVAQEDEK